jgi:hypothetical protein
MCSSVREIYKAFNMKAPPPPKPLYSFFPIYSPFKLEDNDGFDLGEDNRLKEIYIQDEALCFKMSAVLRPGRFLGNHYLAFTIPNRTFIITLARVKEGMFAARKVKQAARALERTTMKKSRYRFPFVQRKNAMERSATSPAVAKRTQPKSFFSRFVDGYLQAERDDSGTEKEKVTKAISDFFARQGSNESKTSDT